MICCSRFWLSIDFVYPVKISVTFFWGYLGVLRTLHFLRVPLFSLQRRKLKSASRFQNRLQQIHFEKKYFLEKCESDTFWELDITYFTLKGLFLLTVERIFLGTLRTSLVSKISKQNSVISRRKKKAAQQTTDIFSCNLLLVIKVIINFKHLCIWEWEVRSNLPCCD